MKYVYNDGGRSASGYSGKAGDCVCRSIASQHVTAFTRRATWFKQLMSRLGFKWTPTMTIGSGCTVHLKDGELPQGRLVVSVSKHYTAVIDGTINDSHNPSERGSTIYPPQTPQHELPKNVRWLENGNGWEYAPDRCVYGYWTFVGGAA